MTDAEFAPHLAALGRCVEEGFRFREITGGLHGFRIRAEALDILLIRDVSAALAARYRMADLDDRGPAAALWSADGSVAQVVDSWVRLSVPSAPLLTRARRVRRLLPTL